MCVPLPVILLRSLAQTIWVQALLQPPVIVLVIVGIDWQVLSVTTTVLCIGRMNPVLYRVRHVVLLGVASAMCGLLRRLLVTATVLGKPLCI